MISCADPDKKKRVVRVQFRTSELGISWHRHTDTTPCHRIRADDRPASSPLRRLARIARRPGRVALGSMGPDGGRARGR